MGLLTNYSNTRETLVAAIETRSAPALLGATHRAFTFYLGNPISSIETRSAPALARSPRRPLPSMSPLPVAPLKLARFRAHWRVPVAALRFISPILSSIDFNPLIPGIGDGKPGRCFVSVAGPQSSRGIGEIEGKAARGSSEREREPSEFQSPRRFG